DERVPRRPARDQRIGLRLVRHQEVRRSGVGMTVPRPDCGMRRRRR
ncbi:unnamed protein product, partial [Ectocarpus sp. 12 AP-2014]